MIGLSRLVSGHGVLFENCRWLHTFCVRFPIDAVFLDGQGRVIGEKLNIRPWRFRMFSKAVAGLLELPAGSVASLGITIGSYVSFTFVGNRREIAQYY